MTVRTVPFAERYRTDVDPERESPDPATQIVAPDGRPARLPEDARCPQCGAGADQRRPSGGFGEEIYSVCARCAFAFGQE